MKTGVYIGSFSPVHCGHLRAITETLKEGIADRVIVVATGNYWNKQIAIDLPTRIACLKVFENENILIDDNPQHNNSESTYSLFEQLQREYPNDTLMLMLGADNLENFEKWINSELLLKNYPFIVMQRGNIDIAAQMKRLQKEDYKVLKCEEVNISSTFLREHLHDREIVEKWMDSRVLTILHETQKRTKFKNNL